MRRLFKTIIDEGVYHALRFFEALARSVPPDSVPRIAAVLGDVWYFVDRRRRGRAHANLALAFPELSDDERTAMTRKVFRNMSLVPLEALWIPRLMPDRRRALGRVRFLGPDFERTAALADARRPAILFGGHLGNWEVGGQIVRVWGVPVRFLARPIANDGVDRHVQESRGGPGSVITKKGAIREVYASIRDGFWVGIVGDQNAGRRGRFVPFFGALASTHAGPAIVACREDVPFIVSTCIRRPGRFLSFDVYMEVLDHPGGREAPADAPIELMARSMATLERWVRLAPDQYNWLHRRWRTRPPGEAPDAPRPAYTSRDW